MIIRRLRPHALTEHLLERRRPTMHFEKIAERFLSKFLQGLHPVFGKAIQRGKRRGVKLDAPAHVAIAPRFH
jgi:hypothetical protein